MQMKNKKGIISLDDWIYDKRGNQYKAVFGKCTVVKAEDVMGCKTGSGQADFVIIVGQKEPMIIAGCQMHTFQECQELPQKTPNILEIE